MIQMHAALFDEEEREVTEIHALREALLRALLKDKEGNECCTKALIETVLGTKEQEPVTRLEKALGFASNRLKRKEWNFAELQWNHAVYQYIRNYIQKGDVPIHEVHGRPSKVPRTTGHSCICNLSPESSGYNCIDKEKFQVSAAYYSKESEHHFDVVLPYLHGDMRKRKLQPLVPSADSSDAEKENIE